MTLARHTPMKIPERVVNDPFDARERTLNELFDEHKEAMLQHMENMVEKGSSLWDEAKDAVLANKELKAALEKLDRDPTNYNFFMSFLQIRSMLREHFIWNHQDFAYVEDNKMSKLR